MTVTSLGDFGMPLALLRGFSFRSSNESLIQEAIADEFTRLGISFTREHSLSKGDRVDFFFPDGGCLEIKTKGGLAEVTRQLHRYAAHDAVKWIGLATTVSRHRAMPDSMCGKPLHVIQLNWGTL